MVRNWKAKTNRGKDAKVVKRAAHEVLENRMVSSWGSEEFWSFLQHNEPTHKSH